MFRLFYKKLLIAFLCLLPLKTLCLMAMEEPEIFVTQEKKSLLELKIIFGKNKNIVYLFDKEKQEASFVVNDLKIVITNPQDDSFKKCSFFYKDTLLKTLDRPKEKLLHLKTFLPTSPKIESFSRLMSLFGPALFLFNDILDQCFATIFSNKVCVSHSVKWPEESYFPWHAENFPSPKEFPQKQADMFYLGVKHKNTFIEWISSLVIATAQNNIHEGDNYTLSWSEQDKKQTSIHKELKRIIVETTSPTINTQTTIETFMHIDTNMLTHGFFSIATSPEKKLISYSLILANKQEITSSHYDKDQKLKSFETVIYAVEKTKKLYYNIQVKPDQEFKYDITVSHFYDFDTKSPQQEVSSFYFKNVTDDNFENIFESDDSGQWEKLEEKDQPQKETSLRQPLTCLLYQAIEKPKGAFSFTPFNVKKVSLTISTYNPFYPFKTKTKWNEIYSEKNILLNQQDCLRYFKSWTIDLRTITPSCMFSLKEYPDNKSYEETVYIINKKHTSNLWGVQIYQTKQNLVKNKWKSSLEENTILSYDKNLKLLPLKKRVFDIEK